MIVSRIEIAVFYVHQSRNFLEIAELIDEHQFISVQIPSYVIAYGFFITIGRQNSLSRRGTFRGVIHQRRCYRIGLVNQRKEGFCVIIEREVFALFTACGIHLEVFIDIGAIGHR